LKYTVTDSYNIDKWLNLNEKSLIIDISQNRNLNIGANFRFLNPLTEITVLHAFWLQTVTITVRFLKDVAELHACSLHSSTAFCSLSL